MKQTKSMAEPISISNHQKFTENLIKKKPKK